MSEEIIEPKTLKRKSSSVQSLVVRGCFNYFNSRIFDDLIILPSLTFDPVELAKMIGGTVYEQRGLYNLLMLKYPEIKVIMLTSTPIENSIVNYYQKLISFKVSKEDFHSRLFCYSPNDSKPISLVEKVLERPKLMKKIAGLLEDPERAAVVSNVSTPFEARLSQKLHTCLLGFEPQHAHYGTKIGSKQIFTKAQLLYPDATPLCHDENLFFEELLGLIKRNPKIDMLVVKLNDSFSGKGNAVLNLFNFRKYQLEENLFDNHLEKTDEMLIEQLKKEINYMRCVEDANWEMFRGRIQDMGILAEVFIEYTDCPSGQGYVENDEINVVSTHDQVLNGHVYIGCVFPCEEKYRKKVHEYTYKVGKVFHSLGIYGNYGVDFLASGDDLYSLEINLRITGTTHPNMALRLLIEGEYKDGVYISKKSGKEKVYIASDNVKNDHFKNFQCDEIIEMVSKSKYHFDNESETGTVLHMINAVPEHCKIGVTCIHNSVKEAKKLYQDTVEFLNEEAKKASECF
eukprot:gene12365-6033_t